MDITPWLVTPPAPTDVMMCHPPPPPPQWDGCRHAVDFIHPRKDRIWIFLDLGLLNCRSKQTLCKTPFAASLLVCFWTASSRGKILIIFILHLCSTSSVSGQCTSCCRKLDGISVLKEIGATKLVQSVKNGQKVRFIRFFSNFVSLLWLETCQPKEHDVKVTHKIDLQRPDLKIVTKTKPNSTVIL